MGVVQELVIQYRANVTQAVKGIEAINKQVQRTNRQVDRSVGALTKKLNSIGTNMTIGVTAPLALMGKAAVKAAMDAVESENLFAVSMGNMAGEARKWSEQVSKSLGLNSYEIRKNVSTFNVMLDSMKLGTEKSYEMAKGLTQLSYDMASFYNLRPEEAFEKLQAGISGEIEPLKRLGILVNDTTVKTYAYANGIAKNGEALTEQQKVLARYGAIMQATNKAQGDMARTLDSPSNALRSMKAQIQEVSIEFGTAMMPAVEKIIRKAKDYTTALSKMDTGHRELLLKTALVAAAAGPVVVGLSKIVKAVMTLRVAYIAAAAAAKAFAGSAVLAAGGAIAAAGTVAGVAAWNAFEPMRDAKNRVKAAKASDEDMIKRGFKKKPNGGWIAPPKSKKPAAKSSKSKSTGSVKTKLPGIGKVSVPKIADIDDFEDTPTLKEIADERAQKSMQWTEDMYTLHRLSEQERYDAYGRILEKNKDMSLSMLAQVSSTREQIGKEIQEKRESALEAELDKIIEVEEKANEKWLKELATARKRSDEHAEKQMIQLEMDAIREDALGNTFKASLLRNKADWLSGMASNLQQTREGKNMDMANKLTQVKFEDANRKTTLENARNIWERIKSYRQEAEEKKKSIAQMMEAERQRQRGLIQFTNPTDIWRQLMVDSVRRQFGTKQFSYVPGNTNGPATKNEIEKAQLDIRSEAQEQTSLLGAILDKITPITPAWEQ